MCEHFAHQTSPFQDLFFPIVFVTFQHLQLFLSFHPISHYFKAHLTQYQLISSIFQHVSTPLHLKSLELSRNYLGITPELSHSGQTAVAAAAEEFSSHLHPLPITHRD